MNFVSIGCSSLPLSGCVSDIMVFCGLKNGDLNEFSGGFLRRGLVKAVCTDSYKFPNQLCCSAIQRKEYHKSSFYKLKEVEKGGSEFYPLMPRTSYAKKGTEVETQHGEEFVDIKEGDIINLLDLIFDENRDYVVKSNEQQVKAEQYGTQGYPFTDERIRFLKSEDDAAVKQPSLELLLGSPERNYLISNKGDRVPIHTLKDKVVALYFFEDAYPFTRKNLAKLETEKAKELNLEMLWDPSTIFKVNKNDLEEIPLYQFAGKRLIIYFEMHKYYVYWDKLLMLKDLYLKMKGTDDEFEVIYIKDLALCNQPYTTWVVHDYDELPWPVHYYGEGYSLPKELEHSVFNYHYYPRNTAFPRSLLMAFDQDGRIVRKTFEPTFGDTEFPFYAGGLEKEFWYQLNVTFGWKYWKCLSEKKNPIYRWAQ
ncbi:hypothetical protein POM88_048243 [Heracleum sosnowskyi]|uniref:Uncharacterized protein n=1 Tax=Heracleum sosnowskyi TaxID=360622 RepID=A0AAD8GVE5_9APIA|nr:hypothetical protein POM88_048243 [Heracleum sosnowskyi]